MVKVAGGGSGHHFSSLFGKGSLHQASFGLEGHPAPQPSPGNLNEFFHSKTEEFKWKPILIGEGCRGEGGSGHHFPSLFGKGSLHQAPFGLGGHPAPANGPCIRLLLASKATLLCVAPSMALPPNLDWNILIVFCKHSSKQSLAT